MTIIFLNNTIKSSTYQNYAKQAKRSQQPIIRSTETTDNKPTKEVKQCHLQAVRYSLA